MTAVPVRQSSFIGGEVAEGLWARTDLKRYADSMRLLRNVIPLQEGGATNRPGWLYQGPARVDTGVGRVREFMLARGTLASSYVLEFTAGHVHVWKNGVKLNVDIVTTYTDEEIPRLKFTQQGDMLTIFCKQKTTQELVCFSDTVWQINPVTVTRAIAAPTNLLIEVAPPGDATVAAVNWQVVVTAVKEGTHEESLPTGYVEAVMAIRRNAPAKYTWTGVAGAEAYNVYRGRNGKFGYVGQAIGQTWFNDDGQGPVYSETPPLARDPFPGTDDQPMCGTYHDQRFVCANSWNNPIEIEMSRMGEHRNFDRAVPPKVTDAVTLNVSGNQYEEIRSILSWGRRLLVMTNASEQMITGSEGVICQDDIVFDDQPTRWGSAWLDPLVIGDTIVFAQDTGSTIRELVPDDKAAGNDLTLIARHLFAGRAVASWCYAHEPFRLIWAARDDGAFLSCTYVRQLQAWAWARHDTGAGDKIESMCAVPEGDSIAVYALILRYVDGAWRRYMEKQAPRVGQVLADGVFLDSAVTRENVTVVTGLTHLIGREVHALADGVVLGPFTVDAQGEITLPALAAKVHVGLRIVCQGHTLDMYSLREEVRERRKNIKRVYAEVSGSMPFKAGQRLTDVLEVARRPDGTPWAAPYTGLVMININSDWDDGGAVVWEHTDPTPLTILSITREVEYGGR